MNFIGEMYVKEVYFSHNKGISSIYKKTVLCRNCVNDKYPKMTFGTKS
jgi:hypothetical protein